MNYTETIVKTLMLPGLSEDTVTEVVTKYADSFAIGFAEWTVENFWIYVEHYGMWKQHGKELITPQQLLTLYKSETTK